jgi:hypothetical protein
MKPIQICHRCPDRQFPCAGACICKLDGKDIVQHARELYCPKGRYQLGIGDTVARVLHTTGVAGAYRKLRGEKGCKPCQQRQHALNVLLPNKEP